MCKTDIGADKAVNPFQISSSYWLPHVARRAGSDGSMSVSGSVGPEFDPGGVVNFHLHILNLGARRGGDVHFLIARLRLD